MKCDICGAEEPDILFLLPIHQEDGKLDTMACPACARKSSSWCAKHDCIHQGFIDGTTACQACVREAVEREMIIHGDWQIYHDVMTALPGEEAWMLEYTLEMSAEMMMDDKAVALLRFAASKALRTGRKTEEVIGQVINSRSAEELLT